MSGACTAGGKSRGPPMAMRPGSGSVETTLFGIDFSIWRAVIVVE